MGFKEALELLRKTINESDNKQDLKNIMNNLVTFLVKRVERKNFLSFSYRKKLCSLFCSWAILNGVSKGIFNFISYLQINHLIDEGKAIEFIESEYMENE